MPGPYFCLFQIYWTEGRERGKMGTGIGLFLGWENGIGVTGNGIWPLRMGNEVLKNGNGIEIMPVDFQFFAPFKFFQIENFI